MSTATSRFWAQYGSFLLEFSSQKLIPDGRSDESGWLAESELVVTSIN